jgi:hypothetical protein
MEAKSWIRVLSGSPTTPGWQDIAVPSTPPYGSLPVAVGSRATGIAAYLEAGGHARKRGGHGRSRKPASNQLYDRTGDEIVLDEVELINYLRPDFYPACFLFERKTASIKCGRA